MKTLIRAVEILAQEDIKEGDRVYLDVKKAKLIPQQMPILKKMLKNGGDGKLLVVRLHENTGKAEVAGWEGDAIMGTLQVPLVALHKSASRKTAQEADDEENNGEPDYTQPVTNEFLNLLDDVAKQAFGHFFLGWKEDSSPAILQPYMYRYVQKQHGSAYAEFSQYMFDREPELWRLSHMTTFDGADLELIDSVNKECDEILASIDGADDYNDYSEDE